MRNKTLLTSFTALAIAFSGCGDTGSETVSSGDYTYTIPNNSTTNNDTIKATKYTYGSGFTIKWHKAQNQYSEVSYNNSTSNYKRGYYIATSNTKGDYTLNCDESWHNEYQINFDCSLNSSTARIYNKTVSLDTGKTYNFFVNAGPNLTKSSTQFTIKYDGNGNITIK